jgi:hypothetical protein
VHLLERLWSPRIPRGAASFLKQILRLAILASTPASRREAKKRTGGIDEGAPRLPVHATPETRTLHLSPPQSAQPYSATTKLAREATKDHRRTREKVWGNLGTVRAWRLRDGVCEMMSW